MLLNDLFKPNFRISLWVQTLIKAGRVVVGLGHPIDNLAAVGVGKSLNITRHLQFLLVVLLIDRA